MFKENFILVYISIIFSALCVFYTTYYNMFRIWFDFDAYQYGLYIFPISILLVWRCRRESKNLSLNINYSYAAALILVFVIWYLGKKTDINLVMHFAALLYIPIMTLLLYGRNLPKKLIFPIFFVMFAIPFGEEIVFILQHITHKGMYGMLRLLNFSPSPDGYLIYAGGQLLEVAKACSGIRYLMVTLIFASLFAYLNNFSKSTSIIFVILSMITPLIFNIFRATTIALMAILISPEYAQGADHTLSGLIFFIINLLVIIFIISPLAKYISMKLKTINV